VHLEYPRAKLKDIRNVPREWLSGHQKPSSTELSNSMAAVIAQVQHRLVHWSQGGPVASPVLEVFRWLAIKRIDVGPRLANKHCASSARSRPPMALLFAQYRPCPLPWSPPPGLDPVPRGGGAGALFGAGGVLHCPSMAI
jgi:hypothetical protein